MGKDRRPEDAALVEHFVSALRGALQAFAVVSAMAERSREQRALVSLAAALQALAEAGVGVVLTVQPTTLSCGARVVHDDASDVAAGLAKRLHQTGLRELRFAPAERDSDQVRLLLEVLTSVMSQADTGDLIVQLWRLDVPGVTARAVDTSDDTAWSMREPARPLARDAFLREFLYRVKQSLSPLVTAARGRYGTKTLEGSVTGDSLSMESHFNLVFRKRGSSERINAAAVAEGSYEPPIVERIAASLKSRPDDALDDELRGLLRKQLQARPEGSSDHALLRRAAIVGRTLEVSEPPQLSVADAATFTAHLLRASMRLGDLDETCGLFEVVTQAQHPPQVVSAVDELGVRLARKEDVALLIPLVRAAILKSGLERARGQVTALLLAFEPQPTLQAVCELLPGVEDGATRRAFHPYLQTEGPNAPAALAAILHAEDEAVFEEGLLLVEGLGEMADAVLRGYAEEAPAARRERALEVAERLAGGGAVSPVGMSPGISPKGEPVVVEEELASEDEVTETRRVETFDLADSYQEEGD